MSVTYDDIMNAVVRVKERGGEVESVVLTDESFDSFLSDNNFSEETEEKIDESLGSAWTLNIDKGETDHLVTESGSEIPL